MKLYHYTSIKAFKKIWESKSLKFSVSKTTNDYFERNKSLRLTNNSFLSMKDGEAIESFFHSVFREIESYKQISLTKDYKTLKGYASPMMWGQYARSKTKYNTWKDGVCIELESSKIERPTDSFFEGEVNYDERVPMPLLEGIDPLQSDAAERYVTLNQKLLFFAKHKHWEHENEYRIVCKGVEYLDISNAIIGIYALDESEALTKVKELVTDESLVYFLRQNDAENYHLTATNLKLINSFIDMF